jgi:hypothetical protein
MPLKLTPDHARWLRLRAQRLHFPRIEGGATVGQIVQACGGMQAQDTPAATLAIRARSSELTAADVAHARVEERTVVGTWAMRGTLHWVAAADLGWLLPLFCPVFVTGSHGRRLKLGLDDDTYGRSLQALRTVLARRGPLTRAEIGGHLAEHGITLVGQAVPHLLFRAALEGHICLGPDRGVKPTYVLLDDWIDRGPALPRAAAITELARRYLAAYGPAGPEDWAAWAGLPVSEGRAAWQRLGDELLPVEIAGRPAWLLKTRRAWLDEYAVRAPEPSVRLLPRFDT